MFKLLIIVTLNSFQGLQISDGSEMLRNHVQVNNLSHMSVLLPVRKVYIAFPY
jgi:hypothetical protein